VTMNASARAPAMKRIVAISFAIASSPLLTSILVIETGGAGSLRRRR
jgi:hypothetical protein